MYGTDEFRLKDSFRWSCIDRRQLPNFRVSFDTYLHWYPRSGFGQARRCLLDLKYVDCLVFNFSKSNLGKSRGGENILDTGRICLAFRDNIS